MRNRKACRGIFLGASLLLVAACEKQQEASQPSLPSPSPTPVTACRNECGTTAKLMLQECTEKLTAEGAFDRLSECNLKADEYSQKCQAECNEKFAVQPQGQ